MSVPAPPAPYVFVTVGTTQFDDLVSIVLDASFASALAKLSAALNAPSPIARVLLQIGRGAVDVRGCDSSDVIHHADEIAKLDRSGSAVVHRHGLTYEIYRMKASIAEDMRGASMVISHAGAGSIFEALRGVPRPRPLIVVVNAALAGNHQTELAAEMQAGGHLLYCEPHELCTCMVDRARELQSLAPAPPPALALFTAALDASSGWS